MCSNTVKGGAGSEEHLGLHHVVHVVRLQLDCDVLKEHLIQNLFKQFCEAQAKGQARVE